MNFSSCIWCDTDAASEKIHMWMDYLTTVHHQVSLKHSKEFGIDRVSTEQCKKACWNRHACTDSASANIAAGSIW